MQIKQNSVIKVAKLKDKETIHNLMQFYFYDFSEFIDLQVSDNGVFGQYAYLDNYWQESRRFPYLIEKEGKLAGFVLVSEVQEGSNQHWSISEFFIMKKFRLAGLGKLAAHEIFEKHKGNWEVSQIEPNKPAQTFWRKVIGEYINEQYEERNEEGRVIQSFCN
ncbi:GNAT family N-acetyltransferase [Fictibacillus nanhaiensis]|uniref:GNAT family N-acetyltransferase n=1 Tax=Fictibacillus nanhaiensis TaxID=742169 RepID=UPI002E20D181|nr:GNAT family N-acetyltransferase [Fictibacillus nanhaiensis]MED1862317.1 GNAT family N-acetyltransferase [Fictibacillus nanhaiensis]